MTFRIRNGDVEIHWPLILLSLISFNQTLTTISSIELFRRCSSVVEARLLSFWEVRNFKRGGDLMIDVNMDETGIKVSGWNYKSVGEFKTFSMRFCYSQVEVRLSAVNTRMICCRRPGLLLATRKALDKLGFGCHQAVISCFDGFVVHVFRALN
uniref:Plant bHLH transcription factor ACT-like domain-containing protein n=1 Tax=Brassica oleracea TaxID=3712 RepID=A0A3P6CEJ8_BRAOL|nr:unnamed protein product [Brassica oleracea]